MGFPLSGVDVPALGRLVEFVNNCRLEPASAAPVPTSAASPGLSSHKVHKAADGEHEGNVLLARAPGIDPASLALSADRTSLTWSVAVEAKWP